MFRASITVAVVALLLFVTPSAQGATLTGDTIVAVVEKQIFTARDLDLWALEYRIRRRDRDAATLRELHPRIISRAVDSWLLAGEGERLMEALKDELIDQESLAAWGELEERAGGAQRLRDLLADVGVAQEEFRLFIREKERQGLLASQLVSSRANTGGASPADGEIRDAVRVRIAHLLLSPRGRSADDMRETALRIRRDIQAGVPFTEAVRLYSDDLATSEVGGELGWFRQSEIAPQLWSAALAVPKGTVTEPVELPDGWHLVRVLDFETPRQREWSEAMRVAEDRLLRELRERTDITLAEGLILRPIEPRPLGADQEDP